jgi:ComF family protein
MIGARARTLAGTFLDAAFPASCPGCGAEGEVICDSCRRALETRGGLPPGVPMGLPAPLPLPLVQLEWCAPFTGAVRAALHGLKYGGERRLAEPIGRAMAARWRETGAGGDLLVPVPIHAARARERGYDQAVLLASVAARELGLPWLPALRRARHTTPQFELGRRARRANVAGAFELAEVAGPAVRGRWVVLVDDVVTTGSTLGACARVLYDSGALAVAGLTAAHER